MLLFRPQRFNVSTYINYYLNIDILNLKTFCLCDNVHENVKVGFIFYILNSNVVPILF